MRKVVLIGLLLVAARSFAQVPDPANTVKDTLSTRDDAVGNLFEQFQSESDNLQLLDELAWRQEHPFDLNAITEEELESLPGVTPFEGSAFVAFRTTVKRFTTIEQIRTIDGVGEVLFEKLLPYVTVKETQTIIQVRSRTTRDLQPRRGDLDSTFVGSSFKSFNRISIESGDIQANVLFEKDGGERFADGFVSGYAAVKDVGLLSQIVAGDFNVAAGQGLVLWRGTSLGKGSEAVTVAKKSGLELQPYRSTDEFNFFRGVAASSSFAVWVGRLDATAFFSRRSLDATVDSSETVLSFYKEGYFRTQTELQKRKAVIEQMVGGRIQFIGTGGWSLGATVFRSAFDKTLTSERTYEFAGREQNVAGVDATAMIGRLSTFGEIATSGDGAVAGITGAIMNIGGKSNVALVYRDYAPSFTNFHANGFGERGDTKNESGFYFGVDVQALQWLALSGYVDHFKFPWRTYSDPLPTRGHEILVQTDAAASSKLDLSARFTQKSTEGTESDVDPFGRDVRPIVNKEQQKYRLTASYAATPRVHVKGRVEFTKVEYGLLHRSERGYLFFQDVRYGISRRFSIEARLVFFQTDSYDSRLYEYENDLRGVFSNPGLYGKGRRWYLVAHYNFGSVLRLSAKYSETQKEGVTSLGSGTTEILGDLDNRLALQLDLQW